LLAKISLRIPWADVIAIVEGSNLRAMDAVIDQIVELPEVVGTETKVARWID
jgi:hypothetical protein